MTTPAMFFPATEGSLQKVPTFVWEGLLTSRWMDILGVPTLRALLAFPQGPGSARGEMLLE